MAALPGNPSSTEPTRRPPTPPGFHRGDLLEGESVPMALDLRLPGLALGPSPWRVRADGCLQERLSHPHVEGTLWRATQTSSPGLMPPPLGCWEFHCVLKGCPSSRALMGLAEALAVTPLWSASLSAHSHTPHFLTGVRSESPQHKPPAPKMPGLWGQLAVGMRAWGPHPLGIFTASSEL